MNPAGCCSYVALPALLAAFGVWQKSPIVEHLHYKTQHVLVEDDLQELHMDSTEPDSVISRPEVLENDHSPFISLETVLDILTQHDYLVCC